MGVGDTQLAQHTSRPIPVFAPCIKFHVLHLLVCMSNANESQGVELEWALSYIYPGAYRHNIAVVLV